MKKNEKKELSDVVEYMELAKKHGIESFYLKNGEFVLEFSRKSFSAQISESSPQMSYIQTVPAVVTNEIIQPSSNENEVSISENIEVITSPITGTFYQAPSPDSPPFVKMGDSVSQGQILCILEAMKLMNEIKSEVSGKIVKIFGKNGELVKQGDPLFHIEI